jgi:hypothetical protein
MDTNFDSKKLELIQWLASVEDKKIIEKLIDFRNEQNSDWWQNASQSERDSITKGLKDAEEGKLNEHSEAKKIYIKS